MTWTYVLACVVINSGACSHSIGNQTVLHANFLSAGYKRPLQIINFVLITCKITTAAIFNPYIAFISPSRKYLLSLMGFEGFL